MKLQSVAFADGEPMPVYFSGEGSDVSPPLRWSDVPEGTREFVLICEDPDAPRPESFVHWLIFNISPSVSALPEGLPAQESMELPVRADQGVNSMGRVGYSGPMPPEGHGWHRYIFTLYALNSELGVPAKADKHMLLKAIDHHVLAKAQLIGRYKRDAKARSA